MRINAAFAAVQDVRPSFPYGQPARVALKSGSKIALARAPIPADIPRNAVVTKADLVVATAFATSGSREIRAQRNTAMWAISNATWNNKPGVTGTVHDETVGALAFNTPIRIDVSADVQAFVSGSAVNRGWRITTDDTTQWLVRGAWAAAGQPYLDFEYVVPGEPPEGLSPDGGAVSVDKPTLTWMAEDSQVSCQVQIDPAADAVSPDFDSGEVAESAGQYALTGSAYAGLADGASTSWRVRAKTDLGWSDWSEWASFDRIDLPVVDITSPGATTGDKTPPITWTPAGDSWRVVIYNGSGKVIANSGIVSSGDQEWTPAKALTKVGQHAKVVVRVWDGEDRIATPGHPIYGEAEEVFELVATGDAPGADTISVSQVGVSPIMRVSWSGAVPDLWKPTRDGKWMDTINGSRVDFYDYYATPRTQHEWKVLAATDAGATSPNGPTANATPYPMGVWLMDPDTEEVLFIMGADPVTTEMLDQAVTHAVLGGPPVRRRIGTPPPSGTLAGELIDTPYTEDDYPVQALAATALSFKVSDQDRVYRLVWGDWNIPVTIGDVNVSPMDPGDHQVGYVIGFKWWQTDDELPWDD